MIGQSSSDQGTLDVGGDNEDNQDGGEDNGDAGASLEGSMRVESPVPRFVIVFSSLRLRCTMILYASTTVDLYLSL